MDPSAIAVIAVLVFGLFLGRMILDDRRQRREAKSRHHVDE